MRLKPYHSGLLIVDYCLYPDPPYKGRGWHITFVDGDFGLGGHINGQFCPAKSIVVHAATRERAQCVANMLFASKCLLNGELLVSGSADVVPAFDSIEDGDREDHFRGARNRLSTTNLAMACILAGKASHRKAYQYGLFKYWLSQQTFPTCIQDLDPHEWRPTQVVWDSAEHHVRCAYAVILAYSVLEELSLEIRASREGAKHCGRRVEPKGEEGT